MSKRHYIVKNRKIKRRREVASEIRRNNRPKQIDLYIDESGNSGLKLFSGSKEFLACGMYKRSAKIMPQDMLSVIIDKTNGIGLHGSRLGLTNLENIADDLIVLYKTIDPGFLISAIDKHCLAAMKLWDCIFDAAHNPGVSGIHIASRPLRIIGMAKFCHVLYGNEVVKDFWELHGSSKDRDYTDILVRIQDVIRDSILDLRGKEIFQKALIGAINNQKRVFEFGPIKEDSPNVTAVVMMAHELNRVYANRNVKISKILHDKQDEFDDNIQALFNAAKQVNMIWGMRDIYPKYEKSNVFSGDLQIKSEKSAELDLCDIACYVFKKSLETDLAGACGRLFEYLSSVSRPIYMTLAGLNEEAEYYYNTIMSLPLSDVQIDRGRIIFKRLNESLDKRLLTNEVEWK